MSEAPKPPAPPLDLAAAFALLREAPAGDVAGEAYTAALERAAARLQRKTNPFRIRPPRAP